MLEGQNEPVATSGNVRVLVSEVSQQVKQTVRSAFGRVSARGDLAAEPGRLGPHLSHAEG